MSSATRATAPILMIGPQSMLTLAGLLVSRKATCRPATLVMAGWPQAGQSTYCPALLSGTIIRLPQVQLTKIGIRAPFPEKVLLALCQVRRRGQDKIVGSGQAVVGRGRSAPKASTLKSSLTS